MKESLSFHLWTKKKTVKRKSKDFEKQVWKKKTVLTHYLASISTHISIHKNNRWWCDHCRRGVLSTAPWHPLQLTFQFEAHNWKSEKCAFSLQTNKLSNNDNTLRSRQQQWCWLFKIWSGANKAAERETNQQMHFLNKKSEFASLSDVSII